MQLKYATAIAELNLINTCPPKESLPANILAFRYTFEDIQHPENFKPQLLKKPSRFNHKSDLEKCSGLGLSLYDSIENAMTNYQKLVSIVHNIQKTIGSHLAEGKLIKEFGVCTSIDETGHFDLHEFENVDLSQNFTIIKPLM